MPYNLRNRFSIPEDESQSSAMPDPSSDCGLTKIFNQVEVRLTLVLLYHLNC